MARTPRADANLESLALSLSEGITADDDNYTRLVRDIAAIRAVDPRMRTITYDTPDNDELLVTPASSKQLLVKTGLYTEWDCLNRHFRVNRIKVENDFAVLHFNGMYNLNRLGELYSGLEGVRYAEPDAHTYVERPASIYVMPEPDGWRYVFGGAQTCRENDIECGFYYFVVSTGGIAKLVETWRPAPHNTPELEPYWLKDAHTAHLREVEKRRRESEYRDDYPRLLGNQYELGTLLLVRFKNSGDLAQYLKRNEKSGGGPLPDARPGTPDTSKQLAQAIIKDTRARLKAMIPPDENGRIGFYVELPSENNPRVEVVQSLRGDWRIYSIEHLVSTGAAP
jgi:hypothetical protein